MAVSSLPRFLCSVILTFVLTTPAAQGQSTIAQQDFDGGTPEWTYNSNHNLFSHKGSNTSNNVYPAEDGWDDDGFYGVVSNTEWGTDLTLSSFSNKIFGITDLDDEDDFGTENTAKITFKTVNISGYQNVDVSFDYELKNFNSGDFIKYEVFEDGTGQGLNNLSGSGTETFNVSSGVNNVKLVFRIKQNSKGEYGGIDNVALKGTAKNQAEPANQPSNFTANPLSNGKIELSWTDATSGGQAPDGYLIKAEETASISQPTDGNDPNIDADLSDGSATVKVGHGAGSSYTFENLKRDTKYDFKIWSFTNAESNIDFLTSTAGKTASDTTLVNEAIKTESFETASGYTFPNGNGISGQDVFDTMDLVTYDATTDFIYSGFDQDHFIAAEDVDGAPGISTRDGVVRIDNIDIAGYRNLKLKGAFAAGANSGYETDDKIEVEAKVDNGSWQSVLLFEGSSSKKLEQSSPTEVLKGEFRDFIGGISGQGDQLDVRITLSFNAGSEEGAVDEIRVTGEPPKKWDGEVNNDDNWSTANNWDPNGVPTANDIVVLDDTHVGSDYTVNLDQNVSNTTIQQLKILPGTGQSIDVGRASGLGTFKLSSANTALTIGDGGQFIDSTSGGLPSFPNNGDILVKQNGIYKVSNNSRSVSTGSLVGALAAGSSPDGEVIYETNGGSLSVSGKTYPTSLTLSIKSNSNDFNTSGGNPFTVDGDFTIGSNVTYDATSRSSGGDLVLKGDFTVNGTLNLSSQQILKMAGSGSQQTIRGLSSINTLTTDNGAGLQLNQTLTVNGTLNFTNGVISFQNSSDKLILVDGATVSGASNSSYVDGTFRKIGDDAFDFPVGANGKLAEIGISAPANTTDTFEVTYFDQTPNNASSIASSHPAGQALANISTKRYWDLKRVGNTSKVDVTLYWTNQLNNAIKDKDSLVVAHQNNNNNWENLGKDNSSGSVSAAGSITKNNVNAFSDFTFGSTNSSSNPLPVELLFFKAGVANGAVDLKWSTASETNNSHFLVQRRVAESWQQIGRVKGHGTTTVPRDYTFTDANPATGTNYYRLKQVDYDGSFEYSNIRAVSISGNGKTATTELSLHPNPVRDHLNIELSGSEGTTYTALIRDIWGQVIYREQLAMSNGKGGQTLPVRDLKPGTYALMLKGPDKTYHKRFVKQ